MCKDATMAHQDATEALDRVITKIQMQTGVRDYSPTTEAPQDMWSPVPSSSIEKGYMKIQGLGEDEEKTQYLMVKIYPNSSSIIHFHDKAVESFFLMKGKLYFKVFWDKDQQQIKRSGFLQKVGQVEHIGPGEWHLVLTSIVETYVMITYKIYENETEIDLDNPAALT